VIKEIKNADIKFPFFNISKYHLKTFPSIASNDKKNSEKIGITRSPKMQTNKYIIGFITALEL
jgi:hypothetical protein